MTDRPPVSKNVDVPVLEGWVTITRAAELLGITRQHAYRRARNFGKPGGFKTLRRLEGASVSVVSTDEIAKEIDARRNSADPVSVDEANADLAATYGI